jgi:outer membrane protein assembly factor BamB
MRQRWPWWLGVLIIAAGCGLISFGLRWSDFQLDRLITLMTFATWAIWVLGGLAGVLVLLASGMLLRLLPRRHVTEPLLLLSVAGLFGYLALAGWRRSGGEDLQDAEAMANLARAPLTQRQAEDPTAWPQWRGPVRDGRAAGPLRTDWQQRPPRELWRQPIGGGYSSIAYVGGKLYTQDRQPEVERVLCLDPDNGKVIWEHRYPVSYATTNYFEGPRATPTIHDGRIYTVGATGHFLCLAEPKAGQASPIVLWQHDLLQSFDAPLPEWGIACSPLIEGSLVIVQPGGRKGSVAAFDRISGQLVWARSDDPHGYSSPVVADIGGRRHLVVFTGTRMLGLNPLTGDEWWAFPWSTSFNANIATPIVVENFVFLSSAYNAGCALLEISGQGDTWTARPVYVHKNRLMRNHHSSCVLVDGYLYGFDCGPNLLTCVDLRRGEKRWVSRDFGKGCVLYAAGHLLVLTEDGELGLVEANPEQVRVKGRFRVFDEPQVWALPTLVAGRLYLRSNKEIVCLEVR